MTKIKQVAAITRAGEYTMHASAITTAAMDKEFSVKV
jgi:hypothetical protein